MVLDLSEAITELHTEKGIDEDLIIKTIEEALTKAYLKYYGTTENLVIRSEDNVISVFSEKEVVDSDNPDDLYEIGLEEAQKINAAAEVGDSMLIPCDMQTFGRIAIHQAKQIIYQKLKEIEKNSTLAEFKSKEGELVLGFVQRIKDGNIFVELGSQKMEAILPKKYQSPLENYSVGDRIRCYVEKVEMKEKNHNVSVVLSRTSPELIRRLVECEIPEIADETVKIYKIAREAGYKTKIAVYSNKDDIDPVGACVGQMGSRVKNLIKELEGEKIDVLKWTIDARMFIKNALIPAEILDVIITDEPNKKAVAIVDDNQLSFAIGRKGANIKLANTLTDWDIDVMKKDDAIAQGVLTDTRQAAEDLFRSEENEINDLELPTHIKDLLFANKIFTYEQLVELSSVEDIMALEGFDEESAEYLHNFIDETFEVQEYEEDEQEEEEDYYECPECGARITEDQTKCPNCGCEISFEYEEDDEEEGENV